MDGTTYVRFVLPAVVVVAGAVLAVSGAGGVALLLVPGPGVLRSAGVLLGLGFASIAAAYWVGPPAGGAASTRGRWMATILVFAAAALFGDLYMEVEAVRAFGGAGALAALLFLAGPAYTIASVLSLLGRRGWPIAAPPQAGAAVGAGVGGGVEIPKKDPRGHH
jgi:hypothetical protein